MCIFIFKKHFIRPFSLSLTHSLLIVSSLVDLVSLLIWEWIRMYKCTQSAVYYAEKYKFYFTTIFSIYYSKIIEMTALSKNEKCFKSKMTVTKLRHVKSSFLTKENYYSIQHIEQFFVWVQMNKTTIFLNISFLLRATWNVIHLMTKSQLNIYGFNIIEHLKLNSLRVRERCGAAL